MRRPHASNQYNIRMKQILWSALHMILERLYRIYLKCMKHTKSDTLPVLWINRHVHYYDVSDRCQPVRCKHSLLILEKEPLAGHCFSVAYESERVAGILYFIHFTTKHQNNVVLTSIKNAFLFLVAGRSSTFCLAHLDSLCSGLGLPYLTHRTINTNVKLQCIYWMYRKRLF